MDTLDSRSLHSIDCYAQQFSTQGLIYYNITPPTGAWLPVEAGEGTFTIEVKDRLAQAQTADQQGRQHNVTVRREGLEFVADPPHLEIQVGDTVLWNTPDSSLPGFAVHGEGAGSTFNSAALISQAIYTHAFGTPGEYRWVDANYGRVSGVVQVKPVEVKNREDFERWMKTLTVPTAVTITDDQARPERVEIFAGQTVFWRVEQAAGITVTDARLVQSDRSTKPQ